MADNIYFSLADLYSFNGGVSDARRDMNNESSEAEHRYERERSRLESLLQYIEHVEMLLRDDYNTACDVKRHNETVLERLEKQLQELNYTYDRLKEAYSRAYDYYKRCCEEETRIHYESTPSTGDEATDKKLRENHAARLNAAHKAVRAADSECYRLKQEMQKVLTQIENTKRDIDTVRDLIYKLGIFIGELHNQAQAIESYKSSLSYDLNELKKASSRFYSISRSSVSTLDKCCDGSSRAIDYGRNICENLDPDSRLDHNACVIAFSDVNALSDMANRLFSVSERFEDDSDFIKKKVRHHSNIMQDEVISGASDTMGRLNETCTRKMEEVRRVGKNCKNADISLRGYYNLRHSSL